MSSAAGGKSILTHDNRKLRILFIMPFDSPDLFAGNIRRMYSIAKCFKRAGIEIGYLEIFPMYTIRAVSMSLDIPMDDIRPNYSLHITSRLYRGSSTIMRILNILKLITKVLIYKFTNNFDILYVPDAYIDWVFIGYVLSRVSRKPLVIVVQLLPSFLKQIPDVSSIRSIIRYYIKSKKDPLHVAIVKALVVRAYVEVLRRAMIIVLNDEDLSLLRSKVKALRVCKSCNGTEIPGKGVCYGERQKMIVFIGSHDERKGVIDLITAYSIAAKLLPELKLITIGVIPNEMRRKLIDLVRNYGLYDRVKFLGIVSEKIKKLVLSKALCLALPSKHESFSLATLEAVAHGTGAVIYSIPALQSIYSDCNLVIMARTNDIEDLANKLIECVRELSDYATRIDRCLSARVWIVKKGLTWLNCSAKDLKCIKKFLKR